MKRYLLKILLVPIIGLLFSGCYTTLWMPDGDNENYDSEDVQSSQETSYYQLNDYGDYYYYYNRPWWYSAIQAAQNAKESNKDVNTLRKNDSGRGEFTRTGSRATNRGIQDAPLPTVSTPAPAATTSSSTNSNTSKDNSGNRVESTNSSNNSSRDKGSDNSNPVRNNDGTRNTSGR
jgi:hypothetical protein